MKQIQPRNFKIRIHNLNVKQTFFLSSANTVSEICIQYIKYFESLNLTYLNASRSFDSKVRTYQFYDKKFHPSFIKLKRTLRINTRGQTRSTNTANKNMGRKFTPLDPYIVVLEIIDLRPKHKRKDVF